MDGQTGSADDRGVAGSIPGEYTLGLTTHPKPLVHKGMTNLCTFLVAHCNGCLGLLLLLWLQLLLVLVWLLLLLLLLLLLGQGQGPLHWRSLQTPKK